MKNDMMSMDPDEYYANNNSHYDDKARDLYEKNQYKMSHDPAKLTAFRQGVENVNKRSQENPNEMSQYAKNVINDLSVLKEDYQKAGGDDPNFMNKLGKLENIYSNAV